MQQHDVDNFLALWRGVFSLVLADCQQFFSPAELQRVTGVDGATLALRPEGHPRRLRHLHHHRRPRPQHGIRAQKLDGYGKLPATTATDSSTAAAGRVVATSIDRCWPPHPAPGAECDPARDRRHQNAVTQMAAGIEPDMPVAGITQLRSEVLQQTVKGSPRLSQQYMQDPGFQTGQQLPAIPHAAAGREQNKLTGRLGVSPTQDGLQSAALMPPAK